MSKGIRIGLLFCCLGLSSCRLDHYKFWQVDEIPFERIVTLKDQFHKKPWQVQVDSIQYIGNPVQINNSTLLDPNTHLVAYFLKQHDIPEPPRWVQLSNQFGRQRWRLSDPALLLVPSGKTFPPETPRLPDSSLDHFVCYLVRDSERMTRNDQLEDQFDRRRDTVERLTTVEPAFFCVPASKNGEPISDHRIHLAMYDMTPTDQLQTPITVWTRDQLRPSELEAMKSLLLAVPSLKLSWGPDRIDDGE